MATIAELTLQPVTLVAALGIACEITLPKVTFFGGVSVGIRVVSELPPLELSSTCIETWVVAEIELSGVELDAHSYESSLVFSATLPSIELEASIYPYWVSAELTLGGVQLYSHISRTFLINLDKTLLPIELEAFVYLENPISADITLPSIGLLASIYSSVSSGTLCLVVNVPNKVVSEYSFSPESITSKDGTVYVSDGTKVYTLSGNDDDGTDIDSIVQLGLSDAGTNRLKRLTDLFFTLRSDGQIKAYIVTDEAVSTTALTLESTSGLIKTVQAITERGNKSTYYGVKFINVNGSDFEIAKLIAIGKILSRRHHA